jgi:hypothetical protein
MTVEQIELPHGAVTWVAHDSNLSRTYVYEYINDPRGWKGSRTAETKILTSIENYFKHVKEAQDQEEKLKADNQMRLNKVLSSSPHE